jgi:hypothetical protein
MIENQSRSSQTATPTPEPGSAETPSSLCPELPCVSTANHPPPDPNTTQQDPSAPSPNLAEGFKDIQGYSKEFKDIQSKKMTPAPQTDPAAPPVPIVCNPQIVPASRRPKGKIATLPKEQRDTINRLLLDGATYALVADRMADSGVFLNLENVSNWFKTGFQEFLEHLNRLDYHRARYEAASDLLQNADTARLPEASLQTAAAQIYDLLGQLAPTALASSIGDDPDRYTRLLNALSRVTREALALQKHRDACARARAAIQPLHDPKRKLTESETRAIVRKVDNILGLSSEDDEDNPLADRPPTGEPVQSSNETPAAA